MLLPGAVLWDMDGVLADTGPLHFATWERVLTDQGIPFDRNKFKLIYGLKNRDLLPFLTGKRYEPAWAESIAAQKELVFREIMPGKLHPLPGVVDWLKRFRSLGCKQAVASSAPQENVEALVDELAIRAYFDALITPGELPGKPDPAVFLLAASRLGVSPEDCIVIEDSVPGVEAAKRANMCCIAVTTTNPSEALTQADLVVETMAYLTEAQITSLYSPLNA